MAKQNSLFLTYKYRIQATSFVNADGTNSKQIGQAGLDKDGLDNDSNCFSISVANTDTEDNFLKLYLTDGAITYNWLSIKVPKVAVTDYLTSTEVLSAQGKGISLDSNGNYYVRLATGWFILASLVAPVSAGKKVDVSCSFEDF